MLGDRNDWRDLAGWKTHCVRLRLVRSFALLSGHTGVTRPPPRYFNLVNDRNADWAGIPRPATVLAHGAGRGVEPPRVPKPGGF